MLFSSAYSLCASARCSWLRRGSLALSSNLFSRASVAGSVIYHLALEDFKFRFIRLVSVGASSVLAIVEARLSMCCDAAKMPSKSPPGVKLRCSR